MKKRLPRGVLAGLSVGLLLALSGAAALVIYACETVPPEITCPADVTIECDESTSPDNTGSATATDNACEPTVTYADTTFLDGCNGEGYIERTWTATDECGNSTSCAQTITVEDTTPPVMICPADVTIECDESTTPDNTGAATGTDNCGTPTVTYADTTFLDGCNGEGYIERTWTLTDDCVNSASCVQTVTVVDTTPPEITCPAAVTIGYHESRQPDNTGTATATDNCGTPPATYTDLESLGGCNEAECIARWWTATDDCGHSSSCLQNITVLQEEFVPEPGSIMLLGSGLVALGGYAGLRLRKRP